MAIPFTKKFRLAMEQYERDAELDTSELMNYYRNIFLNRFVWDNMPEEVPENILEWWAWTSPVVFARDNAADMFFALPVAGWRKINLYWRPTRFRVVGGNGYNREFGTDDSKVLFNDPAHTIPYVFIQRYVNKIENLEQIADLNTDAQANPIVVYTDDQTQLSTENLVKRIKKKAGSLILRRQSQGLQIEPKVLDLNVEFKGEQFQAAMAYYENKILKYLGVRNVQMEKTERLITSEVNAANSEVDYNMAGALETRQLFADKVNKRWGLNISVRVRPKEEYRLDYEEAMTDIKTGEPPAREGE